MKTALPEAINSIAEAEAFLTALYNNGESFHPEDDANGVIWYLPKQTKPTREEANRLNKLMNDIYALPGNDGRHSEPLAFDPCGWLLKLDSYNFLIKDHSGRGEKPVTLKGWEVLERWGAESLAELDDDEDQTLEDFIRESEPGDTWERGTDSFENIGK